jgi:syntaxin 5
MARTNVQDRTVEFQAILQQASKQHANKKLSQQRQSLLTSAEKQAANGTPTAKQRSEFARQAATISSGITSTMAKLERLAQLARSKSLFDDKPVEINQLTLVIKQNLAKLDKDIQQLQSLSNKNHPTAKGKGDQVGEHEKNLAFLLRGKLASVTSSFKSTLEERSKNVAASRSRREDFLNTVSSHSNPSSMNPSRTESPLYQTEQQRQSKLPYTTTQAATSDFLGLEMPTGASSALMRNAPASSQQLLLMEEGGSNVYIEQRGEAIE